MCLSTAEGAYMCLSTAEGVQSLFSTGDRTSVYLRASPLQNLAIPQDFYSSLSISLERSG